MLCRRISVKYCSRMVLRKKKPHRRANAEEEFRKDLEHAKQIVRAAAKFKITEDAFRSEFFAAMFQNCKEKLSCRVASFRQAATVPTPKTSMIDEMEYIATSAVLPVIPST